ncbi:hypothetical protein ACMFMG_010911 [Clarireedia jacksonii]
MADEIYKKVGRGGAGNFYSKQDIDNVTKSAAADLEAQSLPLSKQATATTAAAVAASQPPEYQHTGRGGAGNYITPSMLSSAGLTQTTTSHADSTINPAPPYQVHANANAGAQRSSVVYKGGRGGVGNYEVVGDAGEGRDREREREREREEEIERRVLGDVETGLTKPGKAYDGGGGGKEKEKGDSLGLGL